MNLTFALHLLAEELDNQNEGLALEVVVTTLENDIDCIKERWEEILQEVRKAEVVAPEPAEDAAEEE
ncbi:MAG: hypothetical protein C5B58_15640 [Acidobacteria bacterium]|nr:MAG: hypothetical protein C5B58_15640 [Acidobacteriota bacterium]